MSIIESEKSLHSSQISKKKDLRHSERDSGKLVATRS